MQEITNHVFFSSVLVSYQGCIALIMQKIRENPEKKLILDILAQL
jgi:hypothetical protein